MIKKLDDLVDVAKNKTIRRIAVAAAGDTDVLEALKNATEKGIVEPVLVGDESRIKEIAKDIDLDLSDIEIINIPDKHDASVEAVRQIREGKAEILMKGLVSTGVLLKAVLDKDHGLRKGALLSHVAVFETPYYHKLLGVTDAAMNVAPDLLEKIDIIKNAVDLFHKKASKIKNIISDVAGDVDIILAPNIDGANILYKSLNFLGGATSASLIMGAAVPVVLTSRGDAEKSKFYSIALAAAIN